MGQSCDTSSTIVDTRDLWTNREKEPKKLKFWFLIGLPGAGKSTFAEAILKKYPESIRLNHDSLEHSFFFGKFTKDRREFDERVVKTIAEQALSTGYNVILDNTHVSKRHYNEYMDLIAKLNKNSEQFSIEFILIDFINPLSDYYVTVEECIYRDSQRLVPVGEKVIRSLHETYKKEWLVSTKRFSYKNIWYKERDVSKPSCIIVDIDGTIALLGDRNIYDASNCNEVDKVNRPVVDIIKGYRYQALVPYLFFISGREEKYRAATQSFIRDKCGTIDFSLYMRGNGDYRNDAIIKKELYEKWIKDKYNVDFVLDDRDRVVDMWREQGLVCLQVAPGDF
jgi:predicted kinase